MTVRLRVLGRVQGVGFRPAVCRAADVLGVRGTVRNLGGCAEIVCTADSAVLRRFQKAVEYLPAPVQVEQITAEEIAPRRFCAFSVLESADGGEQPVLPADLAVCEDCLRELRTAHDARYGYPFISCARCGPRYTILRALPYDRVRTTMDAFTMCPLCGAQYAAPLDRRCHGQTISCPQCGPQLLGRVRGGVEQVGERALQCAQALLHAGKIIAVKAVGGYQLLCRADKENTVAALRRLKQRPTKPLAVLFETMQALRTVCVASIAEETLLLSPPRPIVLLPRTEGWRTAVCSAVAGNDGVLGAFLPAAGLYAQLSEMLPLVVTSCNRSGAPMLYKDAEMFSFFDSEPRIAGVFWNTREILRPADDSVARVIGGAPQILRRTRGYLPEPAVTRGARGAVLALGAQMEPSFCLAQEGKFYPVAVPGDIDTPETRACFAHTAREMTRLLRLCPQAVACDLHPFYATSEMAARSGLPLLRVQHHHAHAASVIAEHHLTGKVLGVCFDGTGYGENGAVWGGEFLLCEGAVYRRVAHLTEIPMMGGDVSMRQGWKSALCHLLHAQTQGYTLPHTALLHDVRLPIVRAALDKQVNIVQNSSIGRLFDAVAAVLGLCAENTHQGRCAVLCEQAAQRAKAAGCAPILMDFTGLEQNGTLVFDSAPLFMALCGAENTDAASLGFHRAIVRMVLRAAQAQGVRQVALSGGVFANRLLLEECTDALVQHGFLVFYNRAVPPGDGGIALGQAYLAARQTALI